MQLTLKKGSLKRNIFFMLLGNGVFAFAQWLQISLISKYSSIDTLGFFTLALGIISPVFMFTGLQLRTLIITDAESEHEFSTFFNLRILTSVLSLIIIVLIGVFLPNKELFPFLFLLSFQKILEGLSELFNSKQQQQEKIENLALSLSLKGISIIFSIWLGLIVFQSLFIGLLLILFFYIIILFFNDYRNYKKEAPQKFTFKAPFHEIRKLIIKGLPLGIVLLVISLNANVSKYFLEAYCGTEKQAIYSSISYILIIGLFILDSLGQTFVPRLSKYYYNAEFYQFKKLTTTFVALSFFIGACLYLFSLFFGDIALKFLFNEKISEYSVFLSNYLLVSILIFIASSLGYTLTAMGEFKVQPFINITILLVNIILSFFLIEKYELNGVIIGLGACFSIQIIITFVIIAKRLTKSKNKDLF